MPKPLVLPATYGEYSQRFVPAPSFIVDDPVEGRKVIPLNVSWNPADGDVIGGTTHINLESRTTLTTFSQIRALYVDNSQCGVDVTFIFLDTQWQITIPAGKADLIPVISGRKDFYVVALNAATTDATFIQAFNYMPPPVDISRPVFQNTASTGLLSLTSTNTFQLIPTGKNGTIQSAQVTFNGGLAGAGIGFVSIQLQDGEGTPVVFDLLAVHINNAAYAPPAMLFSANGINVRFINGIQCVVTNGGTALVFGDASVCLFWRTP